MWSTQVHEGECKLMIVVTLREGAWTLESGRGVYVSHWVLGTRLFNTIHRHLLHASCIPRYGKLWPSLGLITCRGRDVLSAVEVWPSLVWGTWLGRESGPAVTTSSCRQSAYQCRHATSSRQNGKVQARSVVFLGINETLGSVRCKLWGGAPKRNTVWATDMQHMHDFKFLRTARKISECKLVN